MKSSCDCTHVIIGRRSSCPTATLENIHHFGLSRWSISGSDIQESVLEHYFSRGRPHKNQFTCFRVSRCCLVEGWTSVLAFPFRFHCSIPSTSSAMVIALPRNSLLCCRPPVLTLKRTSLSRMKAVDDFEGARISRLLPLLCSLQTRSD